MNDISDLSGTGLPSAKSLLKATIVALAVAVAVLALAVLPAEYGIDPTGLGARLGLVAMSSAAEAETLPAAEETLEPASSGAAVSVLDAAWRSAAAYRTDEAVLTLEPNQGGEIKALMRAGERFVFSWTAEGGAVFFDMHGEETNARNDEFTSYWKGRDEVSGHGAFVAPFPGTHGWYWENRGKSPVTVRVRTSGYYEKLYKPH